MLTEEAGGFRFVDHAGHELRHRIEHFVLAHDNPLAIHAQEGKRGMERYALVAVTKCVILREMKRIGCREVEEVGRRIVAPSRLRLRECGVQQTCVDDTLRAAEQLKLLIVKCQHLLPREEQRLAAAIAHSASRRNVSGNSATTASPAARACSSVA